MQRAPDLPSYLQGAVDDDPAPGRFVLTGSQSFVLSDAIAQSLVGRTAVLNLLSLSLTELKRFDTAPSTLWEVLFSGAYPRVFDAGVPPRRWFSDYVATYVERDVRRIANIGVLQAFGTFLRLAAGRTAQELNYTDLGSDAGVTRPTAKAWLSVLEASFLAYRLRAFHRNWRKRLVKAPKLHFLDTGLVCFLLGIEKPDQLITHPLRGAIFESWVVAEIRKTRINAGLRPRQSHVRVTRGVEIDCLVEAGDRTYLVEAKSGATPQSAFLHPLVDFATELEGTGVTPGTIVSRLIYGGEERQRRSSADVLPWEQVPRVRWS